MQARDRLPLDLRRRFRTGRPCLDLVHTGGEGEYAAWEIVHTADDLARWLAVILDLERVQAVADDLAPMRALRAALTAAAHGAAAGHRPTAAAAAAINAAASLPPLVPRLQLDGTTTTAPPRVPAALSTLARDAVDLFGGPAAASVRVCAAEDCSLLFVDASRPGARRWCSMERCGNLAKIRQHRARTT